MISFVCLRPLVGTRLLVAGLFALSIVPLQAGFMPIAQPDASYTSSTTLIPITGADFDTTLTLSDANLTVTFSTLMEKFTVPTTWTNWSSPPAAETSTPRVLSPADISLTTVSLLFSQPLTTFGLEAEPDALAQYGTFPVTLDFFSGVTLVGSVTNMLDGSTSALFAGASMTPITSVTLTILGNAQVPEGTDPGIAQIRYALAATSSVPDGRLPLWVVAATFVGLAMLHRFGIVSVKGLNVER
jgi:hypothetical protein